MGEVGGRDLWKGGEKAGKESTVSLGKIGRDMRRTEWGDARKAETSLGVEMERRKTGVVAGEVGDGGRRARARRSDCWKLLNRKRELPSDTVDAQLPPPPHTLFL